MTRRPPPALPPERALYPDQPGFALAGSGIDVSDVDRTRLLDTLVQLQQQLDIELDPGSDLYKRLQALLADLQKVLNPGG